MANDGKVTIKMLLEDSGFKKSIGDAKTSTNNAFSSITTAGTKAFKGLQTVGTTAFKGIAAGTGIAVTAVATMSKKIIDSYAEYEQLVGGVETLFKTSSDKVVEYANNAYKTAGTSANDYMALITSFSASLLQSLDGDTEKAADAANQAVIDMSDNANKMGTDMEMIQNAYQGFAKQNYTMLDNLKLGYGGTKTEMERLLTDAEKISGIEYDISSFSDVTEAIHVIQTEMGITGTTVKEASSTIQGSVSSMKSAWENFVIGMGDENQDLGKLTENLINSVVTVGENIIPRIKELAPRLAEGMSELITALAPEIGPIIESTFSGLDLGDSANSLGKALSSALQAGIKLLPQLLKGGTSIFSGLLDGLIDGADDTVDALEPLIENIVESLETMIPKIGILAEKIVPLIVSTLINGEGLILELGLTLITALATGLANNTETLVPQLIEVLNSIVDAVIENLPIILTAAMEIILALAAGVVDNLPEIMSAALQIIDMVVATIIDNLPMLIDVALELIMQLVFGLMAALPQLVTYVPQIVKSIVQALLENLPQLIECASTLLLALGEGLILAIPELLLLIPQVITAIVKAFVDADWWKVGEDLLSGIWTGMADKLGWLKEQVKGLVDKVKDWFGGDDDVPEGNGGGSGRSLTNGSHAGGLAKVPYDGYIAELHKNERVLTAAEAKKYNNAIRSPINFLSTSNAASTVNFGNITVVSMLDGRVISKSVSPIQAAENTRYSFARGAI